MNNLNPLMNGGGYWGKRDAAKHLSKRARLEDDKR